MSPSCILLSRLYSASGRFAGARKTCFEIQPARKPNRLSTAGRKYRLHPISIQRRAQGRRDRAGEKKLDFIPERTFVYWRRHPKLFDPSESATPFEKPAVSTDFVPRQSKTIVLQRRTVAEVLPGTVISRSIDLRDMLKVLQVEVGLKVP